MNRLGDEVVKINGLDKLKQALNSLPEKVERNIMRGALREAGKPIRDDAKRRLQPGSGVETGLMKAGIKVSSPTTRGGVVRGGVRLTGKHAWLGHFLEYDVAPHLIKAKQSAWLFIAGAFRKVVEHPGRKGTPFMRPALETQADPATRAAGNYIRKRLATKHGIDIPDEGGPG